MIAPGFLLENSGNESVLENPDVGPLAGLADGSRRDTRDGKGRRAHRVWRCESPDRLGTLPRLGRAREEGDPIRRVLLASLSVLLIPHPYFDPYWTMRRFCRIL